MNLIQKFHSYLLWRSAVEPREETLASARYTASAALLPALMVGLFVFGWYAGLVVLTALLSAFATELVTHRYNNRFIFNNPSGLRDGTWLLTGLLVGLLMPPASPLWLPALAAVAAIVIGKHWWSVDGMPLLQPAAVGLLAVHLLFFGWMHPEGRWPVLARSVAAPARDSAQPGTEPSRTWLGAALTEFLGGDIRKSIDHKTYFDELFASRDGRKPEWSPGVPAEAIHSKRPIDLVKSAEPDDAAQLQTRYNAPVVKMMLGYTPGSIGGASGLALLFGLLLIVFSGAVSWVMPFFALGTLAAGLYITDTPLVSIHLLSGYTLLGFFYLAADPTVGPRSKRGKALAGIAVGLIELILRKATPLSEGTFVSVIFVQTLSIVFDQYLAPPKEVQPPASSVSDSVLSRL
ncbi:MAG: RnfABCDGE type electron transport complex subunit D [Planctomycetes bacterium]|nr:RnfABCDGE type electron transport complex subunit D [Planctomycetota bacterium]